MVCFHPKYIYQRKSIPIEAGHDEKLLKKFNHVSFSNMPNTFQTKIPCGHCLGCILDKASDWQTRIMCEKETWKIGCFVTLTYNNGKRTIKGQEDINSLPIVNGYKTLRKQDITDFKKRLRKHCKGFQSWENPRNGKIENPIRTFECGEYGPTTGRPHYHMIIFNWKPNDLVLYKKNRQGQCLYKSKFLQKIWGCGFVIVGELQEDSAGYVARYTMKKAKEAKPYTYTKLVWDKDENGQPYQKRTRITKLRNGVEPEFLGMSRAVGIGKKYFIDKIEEIKRNSGIWQNGKLKRIPRYFKKIWEERNWEEYHHWKWKYINDIKKHVTEILHLQNLPEDWDDEKIEWYYLKHQEKALNEKAKSLKRDNYVDL